MSKIAFSKLNAKTNQQVNTVTYNNCEIEVKEYLPISEKMDLVNEIVVDAVSLNENYYNPGMIEVWMILKLIQYYSNISFTEKQLADKDKLYDSVVSSKLAKTIIEKIEDEELNAVQELVYSALKNVYSYNNSILGILQAVKEGYTEQDMNMDDLKDKISGLDLQELTDIVKSLG